MCQRDESSQEYDKVEIVSDKMNKVRGSKYGRKISYW